MRDLWANFLAVFKLRAVSATDVARDRFGDVIHTERVLIILRVLAFAAVLVIILAGMIGATLHQFAFTGFVLWSLLLAMAAWLVGCIVGLLFGLPAVKEVKIADGSAPQSGIVGSGGVGYQESTNLEQVADWVTKILIGLTLTSYNHWEAAFTRAFQFSSGLILSRKTNDPSAAAIISIAFAADGFLLTYLAMRRYFIAEMVAGRGDTEKKISDLDSYIKRKRGEGLVQETSVTSSPSEQASKVDSMAKTAAALAPLQSRDIAVEIADQRSDFPDDPWRGKFGGSADGGNCHLSAAVTPLPESDQFFTVRLLLISDNAARAGQTATFYLHPTFGPDPKKVAFGTDGRAALEVVAFGAFTVGVLLEDGAKLELNLATVDNKPETAAFRQR